MPSTCYNSYTFDALTGAIDLDTDTFYVMLVGAGYTEDMDAHTKRSDITSEIVGTGYTAGGKAVVPTVTKDLVNDRIAIVFPAVTWPASTLTNVAKAVYYKHRGGVATADELVAVDVFPAAQSTSNGTFTLGATTIYQKTPVL